MAASVEESSTLISKLESPSISTPIYSAFSNYLLPFTDLSKKPLNQNRTLTLTRSLAKQFLPFVYRCLSILPKRLSDLLNSPSVKQDDGRIHEFVIELFDAYRLCLDCLESVALQLAGKPYAVYRQRLRLACCLDAWGLYREGENEGFRILERLRGLDSSPKSKNNRKKKLGEYLPVLLDDGDLDFAKMVVEVAVAILKCVALGQSKNEEDYKRVIGMVHEVKPWFRVLDANSCEKLHRMLVTYLRKCTQFLAGELMIFDGGTVCAFCTATLNEYAESSMKDQIYKFARHICSVFFLQTDRYSVKIDILMCVLDSLAQKCKVEVEIWGTELVELVAYCASKCHAATSISRSTFAECLNDLAGVFCQVMTPLEMIIKLYAIGLSFIDCNTKSMIGDGMPSKGAKDEHAVGILDGGVALCNLEPVLGSLQSYFYDNCEENCVPSGIDYQDLASDIHLDSHHGTSLNCTQKSREVYLLAYLNVLKFLCKPLSECVISQNKQIIFESDAGSLSMMLCSIQEAFHQFSDIVLYFHRNKSKREAAGFDENKMILSVSVATFILSSRTKHKFQKSVHLIKQIIASEWIQPQELKYIFASLYNVGLILYRNKQVNEALKPLKLCCRASWKCVKLLSEMYMQKSDGIVGDLSEDAILDFITEACNQTVFLLDVLHKSGSLRVKKIIVNSLENWSAAEDLFRKLSGPVPLVKQWVKMQCENNKNMIVDDDAPTLYCLLSSSTRVSKRTIGKILQQELLAYEEMQAVHPEFCQRMQMEVIDILLKDVYATDSHLQKSRVLIRKGRALRSRGSEGLEDCIQCLSKAISVINDEPYSHGTPTCHHLAVTYCLRALCTQEVEPNSKQVFQDIKAALDLWLSIPIPDYGIAYDEGIMSPDSALLFLYNIVDLLAMKGSMEFHNDAYKLMIRLFEWKNVQMEMWLSILWESRRLTHALCVSPVNDALIMTSPGFSGEQFRSIDSWIHCLRGSPPLLVGFQHSFSYLFTNLPCSHNNHKPYMSDITVDDVKEAAFKLISNVPGTNYSFFIAGHLYYDLCERLIANGCLFEALSYAKEAHRLRTKLFKEKFMYTVEKQSENCTGGGSDMQKHTYGLSDVRMQKSIACEVWSFDTHSQDLDACYLSPWKILQCYLESTLQVGTIHELIGNGIEAEMFLRWGKDISCSQSLPLFIVAFSSVLGKLYCNKGSWDLSEKELQNAKHVLKHSCADFSCLKCGLMLKATIDQQLGDLSWSLFNTTRSVERLSLAESLYRSALDRLGHTEWKNSVSYSEDVQEIEGASVCFPTCQVGPKSKMESPKCRKTKKATKCLLKEQSSVTEHNTRLTRSRYHSFQNQKVDSSAEVQAAPLNQLKGNKTCDIFDPNGQMQWLSGRKSCMVELGCEIMCICNGKKCRFCLAREVKKSGLLSNFIYLKWEFARRRLSIRLLSGIGKCLETHGRFHEAHEIISQSISVLVSRNPFTHARTPFTFLLDLVGKELPGDVFSVEHATVLYNISWCSLKSYSSKDNGIICCDLYHVQVPKIVSWLMLAFVLCRQVPAVLQKVSRLLSAIFVLSSSSKTFSLPNFRKVLSESHWASFFHQASLGNNLNYQFLSNTTLKRRTQNFADDQGSCVTTSAWEGAETCNLPRLAPESLQDLEQFVIEFYSDLPCTTVICISLIGGPCANLLKDLLQYPSCISAWMLLSRLKFKTQPIMMLLPANTVLEETSDDDCAMSCTGDFLVSNLDKHWHCPWGSTVVDDVAPTFRFILEENYLSSSKFPLEDTKENRTLWWMKRKKLDHQLGKLLRKIEDSWLGPWRCVLLGDWFNCSHLDSIMKKLMHDLKSKCKINTNESFLKVILQGGSHSFNEEACILPLMSLKKGCFIAQAGYSEDQRCETFSEVSVGAKKLSDLAVQLVYEAVNELEEEESTIREPVILVLDYEVQMLPWENIPILRNQEVYRMPSVSSICFTLDRSCYQQEEIKKITTAFPLIDPLDAFYLLNPGGDLNSTQVEFENWFKDQNLEGKAGSAPTSEELSSALRNHDLFIYFGHGSGAQYISQQEIQKLENCAATLLMGCSSGSLSSNGCYAPQGTALSYLLAGSPVVVANLWEVTDKDIDRFGKAMLDAWLNERSSVSLGCDQCNLVAKEFEAMNIKTGKGKAKKKNPKSKASGAFDGGAAINSCGHRRKIGAFMGKAREACTLPFLIGASPVCYGVPTAIGRKKDL